MKAFIKLFETKDFQKKISKKGSVINTEFNDFKKEYQNNPDKYFSLFKKYKQSNIGKFKKNSSYRIIFSKKNYDGFEYFIAISIFHKDDQELIKLQSKPAKWEKENPVDDKEIKQFENEIDKYIEDKRRKNEKKDLPDYIIEKYTKFNNDYSFDYDIYEKQSWIDFIKNSKTKDYLRDFNEILFDIVDGKNGKPIEKVQKRNLYIKEKNGIGLFYEYISSKNTNIFLIYNGFLDNKEKNNIKNKIIIELNISELNTDNLLKNEELILKLSRRAYPDYILADYEFWKLIELDEKANFAMSSEEKTMLNNKKFPLFINGPAGSGKSTMLHYIFADLITKNKKIKEENLSPLFITYSNKLLNAAKSTVTAILKHAAGNIDKNKNMDSDEFKSYFRSFQNYILNDLLSPEESAKFPKNKYISFYTFNKEFGQLHFKEINSFSAEQVWMVIRTFIKGYSEKEYLDPSNFIDKDNNISKESYETIFNIFWNKWYKKKYEEDGFWDDQDLVRYVLKENKLKNKKKFSAIIVDEAQDYTRIEIELLLKMTIYSDYKLPKNIEIPMAFAGDPFQSINPTGFKWSFLKSTFYEKFSELGVNVNLEYKSLSFNYRSETNIVKFANIIQFIRRILFNIKELEPQNVWSLNQGYPISYFIIGKDITSEDFEKYASQIPIIIPDDYNYSNRKSLIENDDFLSRSDNPDSEEYAYPYIYSPLDAKGLEQKKVLLYKFGEQISESLEEIFNNKNPKEKEIAKWSYYFNKLYVAITRAQEELFIVDTERGVKKLWNLLSNKDFIEKIISKSNEQNWSMDNFYFIVDGKQEDLKLLINDDPLSLAQSSEEIGRANCDPERLRRAAAIYRDHDSIKSNELIAEAYEFEMKFIDAAKQYEKLINVLNEKQEKDPSNKYIKKAIELYFKANNWEDVIRLIPPDTEDKDIIFQKNISNFLLEKIAVNDFLSTIKPFDDFKGKTKIYRDYLTGFIEKLGNEIKTNINLINDSYVSDFEDLVLLGFDSQKQILADIFFIKKSYKNAVKYWDIIKKTSHEDYYTAKLEIATTIEEQIKWLYKLNKHKDIISIHKKSSNKSFEISISNLILNSYFYKKQYENGLNVTMPLENKIRNIANLHNKITNKELNEIKIIIAKKIIEDFNTFIEITDNSPEYLAWCYLDNVTLNDLEQIKIDDSEININNLQQILEFIFQKPDFSEFMKPFEKIMFKYSNNIIIGEALVNSISSDSYYKIDVIDYIFERIKNYPKEWKKSLFGKLIIKLIDNNNFDNYRHTEKEKITKQLISYFNEYGGSLRKTQLDRLVKLGLMLKNYKLFREKILKLILDNPRLYKIQINTYRELYIKTLIDEANLYLMLSKKEDTKPWVNKSYADHRKKLIVEINNLVKEWEIDNKITNNLKDENTLRNIFSNNNIIIKSNHSLNYRESRASISIELLSEGFEIDVKLLKETIILIDLGNGNEIRIDPFVINKPKIKSDSKNLKYEIHKENDLISANFHDLKLKCIIYNKSLKLIFYSGVIIEVTYKTLKA